MAWALDYSEVLGSRVQHPAPPTPTGDYKFVFTIHRFTEPFTGWWVFTPSDNPSTRGFQLRDGSIRMYSGGYGGQFNLATTWGDNETRVIEATVRPLSLEIEYVEVGGASGIESYPSAINFAPDYFTSGTRRGGATPNNVNFIKIEYIDLNNSLNNRTWDSSISDHTSGSQPKVVETETGLAINEGEGFDFPTDGSAWVDLGGGAAEQEITTSTTEQLSQAQTVNISEFNEINAIICQQDSSAQLSNLTLDNQVSTITTEQATHCSLSAIATINTLTAINAEQLTQSGSIDNSATQLIYAVQAQQLSQALTVSITSNGAQDINVVITEQLTHVQTISAEESQQLQAIITQQITQSINTDIEQQLALTAITAEQLTQAVTVTINESSGIFVSVVQTEQLTQAISANIDVTEIISTVITEQLSQYSAQQVSIDLTVSAVIAEQLTQAELINVVLQNISNQLNIDMDQISIEMLTPTYEIEMLTPTYTIEHIQ